MKTFICTECRERFKAPDIEFAATVYSAPQKCPKCGSIRTRPVSMWPHLEELVYRKIWDMLEGKKD